MTLLDFEATSFHFSIGEKNGNPTPGVLPENPENWGFRVPSGLQESLDTTGLISSSKE